MRKDASSPSPARKKRPTFVVLGVINIALMVYTASTRDLSTMLLALVFSTGVGAYFLATGIETRDRRITVIGGVVLATTLISIGLIIAVVSMLVVSSVILPASEAMITGIGAALQAIIAWVCFVMGW